MIGKLRPYIDKAPFIRCLSENLSKHENIIFDMFVSNECNLHCKHCYFLDYTPSGAPLTLKKWYDIIDECISVGIRHFHFSGKEPFCDHRVPLLLERLNELSNTHDIWYGLVTNGTLLSAKSLNELANSNLSYIEFSLEGDLLFNKQVRGANTFDTIYNLISAVPDKDKFNITSTFFGTNHQDLKNLVDKFVSIGLKKFNIAPYLKFQNSSLLPIEELASSLTIDLINQFRLYLETVKDKSLDIRICMTRRQAYDLFTKRNDLTDQINNYVYDGENIIYRIGSNILEVNFPLLYIPYFAQLTVTTDGKIISCADDIHYKNLNEISLGDVNYDSIKDIIIKREQFIKTYINQKLTQDEKD